MTRSPHPETLAAPPVEPRPSSGPEGGLAMSDADFATIAQRIHAETGIVMGAAKRSMVIARLSHRLRRLGLRDFGAYLRLLDGPEGAEERALLVSAITTNVTRFFREPHHFDALAAHLDRLRQQGAAGHRVRLWSAGCSTGQEAYSIAATLLEHAPDLCRRDLRILATDIDPVVIEKARSGVYDPATIGTEAPAHFHKHLKQTGPDRVTIAPALRDLIRFEVLNLLEPWPFTGNFDVVFCRNVVIYFDGDTRRGLWRRFAERIPPGGRLFVGHSERMDPRLDPLFAPAGITEYRRTTVRVAADPACSPPAGQTERTAGCPSAIP